MHGSINKRERKVIKMNETILVFSSVTYALKAQKALNESGISSELIRSPRVREIRGCGYGLRIAEKDKKAASASAARAGATVLAVLGPK